MRTLILAAGHFGDPMRRAIAGGLEPRLDVFELAEKLGADVLDFNDVARCTHPLVRVLAHAATPSAALAALGYLKRRDYDAVLTSGEDIGLPLAALLRTSHARLSHTMIAHTLFPKKKRMFFSLLGVEGRIDRILAYATSEERLMVDELGIPAAKVELIRYHADQRFFRPAEQPPETDLLCAAGQLLRDYDCLIEAARDLPVRIQIAAGSPWIGQQLAPSQSLPKNVSWGKLNRFELRELYSRAALAVVPIKQNHYQTGIATILEMMAMGKCVIASKTHGQTDTIIDGETGIYVPPGDARALRAALERMLARPDEARRIGLAARRFIEENASLDLFVERVGSAVRLEPARRVA